MEWRRFFRLYFAAILIVVVIVGGSYIYMRYHDRLPRFRFDARAAAEDIRRAWEGTVEYIQKDLPRLPGRMVRGVRASLEYIRTSGDNPEARLEEAGLLKELR